MLPKGKYLYHATDLKNDKSIKNRGIRIGWDDCVYLAETEDEALRFMIFRHDITKFAVFKIRLDRLDKNKLFESTDHSRQFFGCDAWAYRELIPKEALVSSEHYERDLTKSL